MLIINALMSPQKDEDKCPGTEKLIRYDISSKIYKANGPVEFTNDEIAVIRKYVDKSSFNPLAYKYIYSALEGKVVEV